MWQVHFQAAQHLLSPFPRPIFGVNFFMTMDSVLQLKGRWESNINVWFPFMYSKNETVQPPYFQNRIIMFCLSIPTTIYLWEIYIFLGSVFLFCCSQICACWPILGIQYIKCSQTHEYRNQDWGRAIPRKGIYKWDFCCSAEEQKTKWRIFLVMYSETVRPAWRACTAPVRGVPPTISNSVRNLF